MSNLSFFQTLSGLAENAKQIAKSSSISFEENELSHSDLLRLLNSNSDAGKLEAINFILAQMMHGENMSLYFPDVVKLVASENPEIRRLVHIYLLQYAEFNPDLALLSVNTVQKTLYDKNPLTRSTAIRVMSSIRVPAINGIVLLAIQQCITDTADRVRQSAALAITKCYSLDPSYKSQLEEHIKTLLSDNSPIVVPAALFAFEVVCPEKLEIIHPYYHRICTIFPLMNDWDKVVALKTLVRYARLTLPEPSTPSTHSDLKELLESIKSCFFSLLPSTIIAGARAFYYLAPSNQMHLIVEPLLQLLLEKPIVRTTTLRYISQIVYKTPELFKNHIKSFFLIASDSDDTCLLKINILSRLLDAQNSSQILPELLYYINSHPNPSVASTAVKALGDFASANISMAPSCLNTLLLLLKSHNSLIVTEAASSLRLLIHNDPKEIYLQYLAATYETLEVPRAKSVTLWLISEHILIIPRLVPDVLRIAVKTFADETLEVKYQILELSVRLYVLSHSEEKQNDLESRDDVVSLLFNYVLSLIHFDMSYDLRDRARFYKELASTPSSEFTRRIVLESKGNSQKEIIASRDYCIGTASLCLNEDVMGYEPIPNWADVSDLPPDSVRESIKDVLPINPHTGNIYSNNSPGVKALSSDNFKRDFGDTNAINRPKFVGQQTLEEFYASETSESSEGEYETSTSESEDEETDDTSQEEDNEKNSTPDEDTENNNTSSISTKSIMDRPLTEPEPNYWQS